MLPEISKGPLRLKVPRLCPLVLMLRVFLRWRWVRSISGMLLKVKVIPQQAEVAQKVWGRLRPRIFLTFGTTRVVGRQPYSPAAFTPGEIPGTHFQRLGRPQGTWFCWGEPRKKSTVTPPGIDPGTVRIVAQCLNHYGTPGPSGMLVTGENISIRRKTSTSVIFHMFNRPGGEIFIDALQGANTRGGEGDETKSQILLKTR